jgi:hypothetical protein
MPQTRILALFKSMYLTWLGLYAGQLFTTFTIKKYF